VTPPAERSADRLLAFEVASTVFALPIAAVLEVAEVDRATCVPGVPTDVAAVMNWHGDPLPLVASSLLVAPDGDAGGDARGTGGAPDGGGLLREQVLVLSDRGDESARLGMPVDRVVGLIEGDEDQGFGGIHGEGDGTATRRGSDEYWRRMRWGRHAIGAGGRGDPQSRREPPG